MDKKPVFLSDVINLEKDIAPYRRIVIYSGVGSGKNTWVNKLAEETDKNILLITSRKITAAVQAKKLKATPRINIDEIYEKKFSAESFNQKIVVVTNAGIEHFLKKIYDKSDKKTHIWNYFDYIILDEAHSLAADATFANSSFHVKYFLEYVYNNSSRAKIIYMTGTPESIKWMFTDMQNSPDYNYLDFYDKCHHIDPYRVSLHNSKDVLAEIKWEYEKGNRIIYFANSIHRIESLFSTLTQTKEYDINVDDISISYSDMEKNKRNFPKDLIKRSIENEKYLREHELLKDEIKIFLTTCKNQEGININNPDIPFVVAEAQDRTSLIQMAGRVREGIDDLAIVYDAQLHESDYSPTEYDICSVCLPHINDLLHNDRYSDKKNLKKLIELVEQKFLLIRYNYFEEKFSMYEGRIKSFEQIESEQSEFKKLASNWLIHTERVYSDYWGGYVPDNKLTSWFPYSIVVRDAAPFIEYDIRNKVQSFINNSDLLGKTIKQEEKNAFKKQFRQFIDSDDILKQNIGNEWKNITSIIKKYGYKFENPPKRGKSFYILSKIKE